MEANIFHFTQPVMAASTYYVHVCTKTTIHTLCSDERHAVDGRDSESIFWIYSSLFPCPKCTDFSEGKVKLYAYVKQEKAKERKKKKKR